MDPPNFNPNDYVIINPTQAAQFNEPSMTGDRFHLLRVLLDKGETFDYDHLLDGPCALVEAIAISAKRDGERIWFPNQTIPPKDNP